MVKKVILLSMFLFTLNSNSFPVEQIHEYDLRYQLKSTNEKLVDNLGNNYEALYGVRNFRAVLSGLVYRGGANNSYNKYKKRANMNPLPEMGLENLCKEGFHDAIYLYPTNYNSAPKSVKCKTYKGEKSEINYSQITAFDEPNTEKFLKLAYDMINDQKSGPLYIHCWNGWHASGVISALMLRQFCGLSATEALNYWIENTDEHNVGYDDLKARIKNFKPLEKYKISKESQKQICF